MSIDNGMNTQLGTKWFTFYTKIRPLISCVFTLIPVADFLKYSHVYFSNIELLLSFIANLIQVILGILVWIKAIENYNSFVKFVNGVLIFETCNFTFQVAIQRFFINKSSVLVTILVVGIAGLLDYLFWYRLNIKYFRKRIVKYEPVNTNTDSIPTKETSCFSEEKPEGIYTTTKKFTSSQKTKVRYCSRCGALIDSETKKCTGCGKQYFRGLKIHKFSFAIIILSLVIVGLSTLCISQHIREQELREEIRFLGIEIDELNHKVYNSKYLVDFIDTYVVFIEDDGTSLYHKFECPEFKRDSFWVYNIENAVNYGYSRCPHCH